MTRRRRFLMALTALLMAVLGALAGAEIAARMFGDKPQRPQQVEGVAYVGQYVVPEIRRVSADPVLSNDLVPGQRTCSPAGCLTITESGVRRSPAVPPLTGQDLFNIVMIGDSFTFGYGVNDNQTLPAHLESLFHQNGFPKVRVLNLGVSGYNAAQSARALVVKANGVDTRIVIYNYMRNDTEMYWQESNPVLWELTPVFAEAPFYQKVLVRSHLFEVISRRFARKAQAKIVEDQPREVYTTFVHKPWWPGLWMVRESLLAMKGFAELRDAELMVALLPDEMPQSEYDGTVGIIAAMCRQLGINTIETQDAYLAFEHRRNSRTSHGPGHFNSLGNEFIAGQVFDELRRRYSVELAGAQLPVR